MTYMLGLMRTDRGEFKDRGNQVFDVTHPSFAGGAKGDGVHDDTKAIQAAINACTNGSAVFFPTTDGGSIYVISDELTVINRQSIRLVAPGPGAVKLRWIGAAAPTKAMLRFSNSSYCVVDGLRFECYDDAHKPAYGVWITSPGAFITQFNTVIRASIYNMSDAGVQIGHPTSNIDQTTDGNRVIDSFISFCAVGVRVCSSNSNQTQIKGGAIAENTVAGIEIAVYARGVYIEAVLFFLNGLRHIWLRKEQSGPVTVRDISCELYIERFLEAEVSSGGVAGYNLLTLDTINCTAKYTDPTLNMIEYAGSGSVIMKNTRWDGGAASSLGAGGKLVFRPANISLPGEQYLSTEGTHLYNGATFDVETRALSAYFSWDERGTTVSSPSADDPVTRMPDRKHQLVTEFQVDDDVTPAGVVANSVGRVSRVWIKKTIPYTVFKDAALSQAVFVSTFKPHTRVLGAFLETTVAFSGLAGTITAQLGVNADNNLILSHDVKSAAVFKGAADADLGTAITRANAVQGGFIPDWSGTPQPYVTLTSGTGNLGTGTVTSLSAGSISVYLLIEVLP